VASTAEASLLAALAAGRAWCASLSKYRGSLDLLVNGTVPMGSAIVSAANSRKLVATATGIPGWRVAAGRPRHGRLRGHRGLTANAQVVGTYPAAKLAVGSITRWVDTSQSRFFRTQVTDSTGTVVGLSNPAWLQRRGARHVGA
jgi:hypothetical protein